MNKILSLAAILAAALAASANAIADEWTENADAALAKAKAENKSVLVNFTGSDWCSWCKKLEGEIFATEKFKAYATENLVLLKLDFPSKKPQATETRAQNEEWAKKHGVRGFPTVLVLDSSGNAYEQRLGYMRGGAEAFVSAIEQITKG